jgi:hypothetical protein
MYDVIHSYVALSNGVERDEFSSTGPFAVMENGCLTTTLLALTRPDSRPNTNVSQLLETGKVDPDPKEAWGSQLGSKKVEAPEKTR